MANFANQFVEYHGVTVGFYRPVGHTKVMVWCRVSADFKLTLSNDPLDKDTFCKSSLIDPDEGWRVFQRAVAWIRENDRRRVAIPYFQAAFDMIRSLQDRYQEEVHIPINDVYGL